MMSRPPKLPVLLVEGVDDISAIANLLARHGYDTERGSKHLFIRSAGSVEELLEIMADTVKAERNHPCGFVLDIDIDITNRWKAVADRLAFRGDPVTKLARPVDPDCPSNGYFGRVDGYPHQFGVWLMPDCTSSNQKLENLLATLIPTDDPLRIHAIESTKRASELVDSAPPSSSGARWGRFSEPDRIKAEMRAWLAWQREPGVGFGAAINSGILSHDSSEALAFLAWLGRLFEFEFRL